jgi:hypothetical protein
MTTTGATQLVKSVSVANMVNQRAAALAKLRRALDLIAEANRLAAHAHVGFPVIGIETNGRRCGIRITGEYANRPDVEARILQDIDSYAWGVSHARVGTAQPHGCHGPGTVG